MIITHGMLTRQRAVWGLMTWQRAGWDADVAVGGWWVMTWQAAWMPRGALDSHTVTPTLGPAAANYYPKGHAKAGRCHPYHKIANLRLLGVVSHPPGYETGASGAIRKSRAGRSIPKGPRFEFEVMNVTRDTLRADPARFLMP